MESQNSGSGNENAFFVLGFNARLSSKTKPPHPEAASMLYLSTRSRETSSPSIWGEAVCMALVKGTVMPDMAPSLNVLMEGRSPDPPSLGGPNGAVLKCSLYPRCLTLRWNDIVRIRCSITLLRHRFMGYRDADSQEFDPGQSPGCTPRRNLHPARTFTALCSPSSSSR
ncbi:hypothetical protein Hypma_016175 [Hypsizygus marmoreus]|uniref:Uncharacterized protein n=1 Tax=Hypsizygus marmoreus TaxID=39966 RepID=A0A369IYZ9_HYPMA|nr:hypothetical protein Hypma_016175 [Hypsizygus marmoreus]